MGDGESRVRVLVGTAFAGEPALPDVDDALAGIMALGHGIRRRQRVRTGVAAAVLCVSGFGMIAGIATLAHGTGGGGTMIAPAAGNSNNAPDPVPSKLSHQDRP
jgi:hypothetical protein